MYEFQSGGKKSWLNYSNWLMQFGNIVWISIKWIQPLNRYLFDFATAIGK